MADNVAVTAGSGVTIGADEVTINGVSQKVQRVKILDATDGSTNVLSVASDGAIKTRVSSGTVVVTSGSIAAAGALAHDAAATGNPVRVAVRARGTLSGYTVVATNDVSEVHADRDGVLLTRAQIPLSQNLTTRVVATTAAAAGFTQLAATTLVRNYVTGISVYNHGATAVFVNFLNGTTAADQFYTVGANAKAHSYVAFNPPLRQASTNKAFGYKVNAAIGGSGVIISVTGFQSAL